MDVDGAGSHGKGGYHHGDLRQALLATAAEMLEDDGPEGLSLRAVARVAGVSPRAPYRHFADREALLAALAADAFERFADALDPAVVQIDTSGDTVAAQAAAYVRFALAGPGRFRLMFGPRRMPPEGALAVAKERAFGVLERSVALGARPGVDARARAVGAWAMAHGLAVLFLDEGVRNQFDGDDDEIIRRVTAAMLGQEPGREIC